MNDCLELRLRTATPPENAAMKRLARHAAWTLTTYQKDNESLTAHQEIRGKTFDVQEAAFDGAVVFKPHRADGHVKDAAPQGRYGIWSDFNSRAHEHIVRGEGEIVPYETIRRRKPENVWCKQLVLHMKCAPLSLKGGDAAVGHMVAEDRGEGLTGEPSGQIGKRADITESTVDESGATHGCRGCLVSGATSAEACHARLTERLLNAPEHAEKAKVADEKRRGLPDKPRACEIADVGDSDTVGDLPVNCQACGVRRANRTCGGLGCTHTRHADSTGRRV
jgi:hypothetical protein